MRVKFKGFGIAKSFPHENASSRLPYLFKKPGSGGSISQRNYVSKPRVCRAYPGFRPPHITTPKVLRHARFRVGSFPNHEFGADYPNRIMKIPTKESKRYSNQRTDTINQPRMDANLREFSELPRRNFMSIDLFIRENSRPFAVRRGCLHQDSLKNVK